MPAGTGALPVQSNTQAGSAGELRAQNPDPAQQHPSKEVVQARNPPPFGCVRGIMNPACLKLIKADSVCKAPTFLFR
jgi:hypothetical protein